jgi:hypothetical protein
MNQHRLWMVGLAVILAAVSPNLFARGGDPPGTTRGTAAVNANVDHDALALAARIGHYFAEQWTANQVEPAAQADDAEYLRRLYLDLAGRIPSVSETRAFLSDPAVDKRQRLTDRLLKSPAHVAHFTNVWRALMIPEANTSFQGRFLAPGFEAWLTKLLRANTPYDQMVRELITAPLAADGRRGFDPYGRQGEPTPLAYYMVKEVKPENLAASTARLFLGVRVECAQCHNHPFASWKREQFWGLAAFFAGIQSQRAGEMAYPTKESADKRELEIPGTDRVVQAIFLDGTEPQFKYKVNSRETLADWMTAPGNRFFARAAVNRMWAHFFGSGLIDPVDDMEGQETAKHHPQLLDELAQEFAAHRFDLHFLIKAITASRVYQLSSVATNPSQDTPHLFARMAIKGLTPEQLFDSLVHATGFQEGPRPDPRVFGPNNNSPRLRFVEKFGAGGDKPNAASTSILQALALMNGKFIADATSLDTSETLAAVVDAPFLDTAAKVETLYLATLSRPPRPEEMARLLKYLQAGGGGANSREALADIFWALLNSSEFYLNH